MSVLLKTPTAEAGTPHKSSTHVVETVSRVLEDIRANGDSAVRKYSEQFDKWTPNSFRLGEAEIAKVVGDLPTTVFDDLTFVQRQVRDFARGLSLADPALAIGATMIFNSSCVYPNTCWRRSTLW